MACRPNRRHILALTAAWAVAPIAHAGEGSILVFAAASTRTALDMIATGFSAQTGHRVTMSYAGSSTLGRQIQNGAPADVFLSANRDWMDALEADGLLEPGSRADLLTNRIVLVAHGRDRPGIEIGPALDLPDLLGDGRLAMALVDAVPAGIYGRAALMSLGLWERTAPMVAQTDNARAALALVATGAVPFGIVYATDAAAEPDRVSVVGRFPADLHPPIVYPVAALRGRSNAVTPLFLDHLRAPAARAVFLRQGFGMAA